jgi:hypothetical protein
VARVAWSNGNRFGVQTQDRINVPAILGEPDLSKMDYKAGKKAVPEFERRSAPRSAQAELSWRAERNRHLSRTMEFACVAALTASIGMVIFEAVSGALSAPLAVASERMSPEAEESGTRRTAAAR